VAANLQAAADSLVEEIVGAPDEGTREQCQAILAKIWARHTPMVSHDSKAAMLGSTIDDRMFEAYSDDFGKQHRRMATLRDYSGCSGVIDRVA
jgi:ABC-type taurine transport system ATPase subunit